MRPIGHRVGRLGAVAAMFGGLLMVSACSASCATEPMEAPHVELIVSPWTDAHPGNVLRACIDAECTVLPAGEADPHLYGGLTTGTSAVYTLTVTATKAGRPTLDTTTRFRLETVTEQSACGDSSSEVARVALNAAGGLTVAAASKVTS